MYGLGLSWWRKGVLGDDGILMVRQVSDSREVQGLSSLLSDESSDESLQENTNKTAYLETYD